MKNHFRPEIAPALKTLNCAVNSRVHTRTFENAALIALAVVCFLSGCTRQHPKRWQGYLEGEFVYVGSPIAGQLETLAVTKGDRIEGKSTLFTLEHSAELAMQRQAAEQLAGAQSRLEDLRKGSRPTELAALEAQVEQARVTAELARNDLQRIETLHQTNVVAESEYDRVRLTHERAARALDQLNAQLATARLGGRTDLIAAAQADVRAAEATKQRADWAVDQKTQAAPRAGLVYDTLFRAGEFVPAGSPVVALLAPELLKVRFFVPEGDFSQLKAGDNVQVTLTGRPAIAGRVSFMSPSPEYTPPVLYNRENRAKLVFMVEATLPVADARDLHPGQPVDVSP
jgi:HlyD family secretion protein